jgi:glycosyltransferase involved in cell wall biosynthesis
VAEPKKIAFISIYTSMGGGEYGLLYLIRHLDRSKYYPTVIVNGDGPLTGHLAALNVEVINVPFKTTMLKDLIHPSVFKQNLKASFILKQILRDKKIGIIQCADVLSLLLLLPSLLTKRIPVVYSVIFFYEQIRAVLFNFIALCCVKKIVTLSRMVSDDLKRKTIGLEKKMKCIYWGVDITKYYPRSLEEKVLIRKKYNLPLDKNIVGFIGRYDLWKGHHTFLDAAVDLMHQRNDLIFLIAGGAPTGDLIPAVAEYHKSVKDKIAALNNSEKFILLDHTDDIPEIMSALDVFVCPSDSEPFGLVVLEAVACGIPAVVSETVGAVEILNEAKGVCLALHKNPKSFSQAVQLALQYSSLKTDFAAENRPILSQFSWQEYSKQYQDLYDSL